MKLSQIHYVFFYNFLKLVGSIPLCLSLFDKEIVNWSLSMSLVGCRPLLKFYPSMLGSCAPRLVQPNLGDSSS